MCAGMGPAEGSCFQVSVMLDIGGGEGDIVRLKLDSRR
jgi:hypothetical protein